MDARCLLTVASVIVILGTQGHCVYLSFRGVPLPAAGPTPNGDSEEKTETAVPCDGERRGEGARKTEAGARKRNACRSDEFGGWANGRV